MVAVENPEAEAPPTGVKRALAWFRRDRGVTWLSLSVAIAVVVMTVIRENAPRGALPTSGPLAVWVQQVMEARE